LRLAKMHFNKYIVALTCVVYMMAWVWVTMWGGS